MVRATVRPPGRAWVGRRGGRAAMHDAVLPGAGAAGDDPLHDPHRIAAARRLLLEVHGHAAFDRLSALAARLVGAGHAKVTLFTDQDLGRRRLRPAPGCHRRPRAADRGAVGDRRPERHAAQPARGRGGRAGRAPARRHVRPGPRLPRRAADRGVRPRGRRARRLRPGAARVVRRRRPSCWCSSARPSSPSWSSPPPRSAVGTSTGPAGGRARGQLDRHLGDRPPDAGSVYWDERCAALFGVEGARRAAVARAGPGRPRPPRRPRRRPALDGRAPSRTAASSRPRPARSAARTASVRWMVTQGRVVSDSHGEPVRVLGTILDVTDARRQAEQRLAAFHRADGDRRGRRGAGQRRPRSRTSPRSCCAVRGCSARSPAPWPSSTPRAGRCGCT